MKGGQRWCSCCWHSLPTLTTAATIRHPDAVNTGDIGMCQRLIAAPAGGGAGGTRGKCAVAARGSSTRAPCGVDQRWAVHQCAGLARTDRRPRFVGAGCSPCGCPATTAGVTAVTSASHQYQRWQQFSTCPVPLVETLSCSTPTSVLFLRCHDQPLPVTAPKQPCAPPGTITCFMAEPPAHTPPELTSHP
jgi:hypothetical protein